MTTFELERLKYDSDLIFLIIWILSNILMMSTPFIISMDYIKIKNKSLSFFLLFICVITLSSCLVYTSDYLNYQYIVNQYKVFPNTDYSILFSAFFIDLIYFTNGNYFLFRAIILSATYLSIVILIYNYNKKYIFTSFAIIIIFMFDLNANILRASLAYSIFFLGIILYLKRKIFLIPFFLIGIASWLHITILFNLIPFLLSYINITKKSILILFSIFIFSLFYINDIIDNVLLLICENNLFEIQNIGYLEDTDSFIGLKPKLLLTIRILMYSLSLIAIYRILLSKKYCNLFNHIDKQLARYAFFVFIITIPLILYRGSSFISSRLFEQNYTIIVLLLSILIYKNIDVKKISILSYFYILLSNIYIYANYRLFIS